MTVTTKALLAAVAAGKFTTHELAQSLEVRGEVVQRRLRALEKRGVAYRAYSDRAFRWCIATGDRDAEVLDALRVASGAGLTGQEVAALLGGDRSSEAFYLRVRGKHPLRCRFKDGTLVWYLASAEEQAALVRVVHL